MNNEALLATIERYKQTFNSHRKNELYKWEAVKWFKSHWSANADDFHAMLKTSLSKAANLLTRSFFYARRMIVFYAEREPEIVRAMFKELFDDTQPLKTRVENFMTSADQLSVKYADKGKRHFQDPRSISVYLVFNQPDKHYIYLPEKFKTFAETVSADDNPKGSKIERLFSYFEMCDEVLNAVLADTALKEMSAASLSDNPEIFYQDEECRLLTDDIIYNVYRESKQGLKESDWWPPEDDYNPGIDVEQWQQLWNNEKVFNEDSKHVLSCFMSFEDGATCTQVGMKFGKNGEFYNRVSSALAERVYKETECELPPNDKNAIWWPILYIGKRAGRDIEGVYIWKLRQELREALEEMGIEPPLIDDSAQQSLEKEFISWFRTQSNNGKSYSDNYLTSIRNALKSTCKKLIDVELQQPNLFFQTNPVSFIKLQADIKKSRLYEKVNADSGNGSFSRGMDFYKEFLENRINNSGSEVDENDNEVGYYPEIIVALKDLGGRALWRDLCDNIEERGKLSAIFSNPTWRQTVSSYLQFKCSDSPQFKGKEDLFTWDRATKIWGLRNYTAPKQVEEKVLPKRNPRRSSRHQMNAILYGAPGTGKTYSVTEYAMAIIEDRDVNTDPITKEERGNLLSSYKEKTKSGQVVFTTFHQSYGYEDFIQGLRPLLESESMKFSIEDGVFKKISDKAMMDNDNNYVIIIDEINRANISRVFGELITLIEADKRWGEANELSVTLPSGDLFAIPNNLYIIGTMNSADKSISLIDTALRRRFDFIEIAPNESLIENSMLRKILKALNKELLTELDSSDLLIGHAYFINKTESDLVNIMNRNIIPLLYEYFHDNERKVKSVVNKAIEGLEYHIENKSVGRLRIAQGTV